MGAASFDAAPMPVCKALCPAPAGFFVIQRSEAAERAARAGRPFLGSAVLGEQVQQKGRHFVDRYRKVDIDPVL